MAGSDKHMPQYVTRYYDRHGKARFRFRRKGFQRAIVSPNHPEFKSIYDDLMMSYERSDIKSSSHRYSLKWLIEHWQVNGKIYESYKPKTKKDTDALFSRMIRAWGDNDIRTLTTCDLETLLDDVKAPATYNRILGKMRQLLKHAKKRGWVKINAADAIDRIDYKRKHTHGWTLAQREQFKAYWKTGTRERLAYTLMFVTVQASADAVHMGRHLEAKGNIEGKRVKTGVPYCAPITPELETELSHWRDQIYYILTQQGRPFSERGFHMWFSDRIRQAGLPDECTPHGLRVAGCEELAETGSTATELMSLAGFETMAVAQGYVKRANKKMMAREASRKRNVANLNRENGEP